MTTQEKLELAHAVAMHAVKKFGDREGHRDTLIEGACHEVDLKLSGTVDGVKLSIPIKGALAVGNDNPTGSTRRPDMKSLLCAALAMMAKTRRLRLVDELEKGIPEPDPEMLAMVEAINQRHSTRGNKRGAVSFVYQPTK